MTVQFGIDRLLANPALLDELKGKRVARAGPECANVQVASRQFGCGHALSPAR